MSFVGCHGLAGMGWGMQVAALVAPQLASGVLVELVPGTPLDVPLHWQHTRAAGSLVEALGRQVRAAALAALIQP